MTDDPLQHKSHADFHPHTTTMAAGCRIAKYVQSIVTRDTYHERFNVTHYIDVPYSNRIGTYTAWIQYKNEEGSEGDYRHTFNIELMLSMRDDWKEYVEKHVLKMMKEAIDATG